MNNNDDVFLKQMKGVSPIKKNNKIKKEEVISENLPRKTNFRSPSNVEQHGVENEESHKI